MVIYLAAKCVYKGLNGQASDYLQVRKHKWDIGIIQIHTQFVWN